jgi:diguanylate cyclase (GGDEF)-like protein
MVGFGLIVGLSFPLFVLPLGVSSRTALRPGFLSATLGAGLVVGLVNFLVARTVVGKRVRLLIESMRKVESVLSSVARDGDSPVCEPETCHVPVDSVDELGEVASAFNRLVDAAAYAYAVEHAACDLATTVARSRSVDQLCADGVDRLMHRCGVLGAVIEVHVEPGISGYCSEGLPEDWDPGKMGALEVFSQGCVSRDGKTCFGVPVRIGTEPIGVVGVVQDGDVDPMIQRLVTLLADGLAVSLESFRLQEALSHTATHDGLTGLANRRLLLERMDYALGRRQRWGRGPAVIMLDLDDFKGINDSLGHSAGDELLRTVADRLVHSLRSQDTSARFGGDEFAVLIEECEGDAALNELLGRLLEGLSQPVEITGRKVTPSVSLGASRSRPDSTSNSLLQEADTALYVVKRSGKGQSRIFDPSLRLAADQQSVQRTHFSAALDRGELALSYQPLIELSTGRLVGAEGLMRWTCHEHGSVPPMTFISIAEESGLIHPVGRWALRTACAQAKEWLTRFGSDSPYVAMNLSALQVHDQSFVESVEQTLADHDLPPDKLLLELTESVMVFDPHTVLARLRELKRLGVQLALDDFGTGFSSLSYLTRFPGDIVKFDKSFIDDVTQDGPRAQITYGLLQLVHALELTSVAEGVEHPDQAARLQEWGCDLGQGYHFSRPGPAERIEALLTRQ